MKKIQFKNEALTRTKTTNNIVRMFEKTSASDRYNWYLEANEFCTELSEKYDVYKPKIIGILAALSPVKTWEQNKKITEDFLTTGKAGTFGALVIKSKNILESDGSDVEILQILNGKKISAFYLNIKYPNKSDNLTIDRHALSISLGRKIEEKEYTMTKLQYSYFVECYKLAAVKLNVSPLLVQSATWVYFRKNY